MKFSCSFFKCHSYRAVSAVVYIVAGCLVGKKVDVEVLFNSRFQKINDIAVVCDGNGFLSCNLLICEFEDFIDVIHDNINPALIVSCLDSGKVNFRKDTYCICDVCSLRLSAAHAAKSRRYESMSCKVSVLRNAKFFTTCIQNCVECSVNDALRSDVHPSACCHLSVVSNAHFFCNFPIVEVVIHTNHQSVCDDDSRCCRLGWE